MWEMLRAAWIGMRLTCPACGQGRIYRSLKVMNHECPTCGVIFEREEGDFLGAMVIAYSVTSVLVAAGVFLMLLLTEMSATQHVLFWTVTATLFLLTTYRNMKGIWIGILHVMVGLKRHEG